MHLLRIIHLEISIQNISLVLSCESHPKCKLKPTDNCIKRTLHKVNNPSTRKYKHRCFIPGGKSTKRGGEHHIATGHGPMVQGGLLTTRPGGVHGDGGGLPEVVPTSGRVPGQLLLAAPIL